MAGVNRAGLVRTGGDGPAVDQRPVYGAIAAADRSTTELLTFSAAARRVIVQLQRGERAGQRVYSRRHS
jgi:hypothetical protein